MDHIAALYDPASAVPEPGITSSARTLAEKKLLISGGSRGIGLAIALRAAADGAHVALMAKTDQPHPKLEGTVHTAVEQIEAAGGRGLAIVGDVRNDEDIARAVEATVADFGGIDVVVNNASAIDLTGTEQISMKKFDLMHQVNARGAFALSQAAIPHLKESEHPHILTLSPPLDMSPRWFGPSLAYTMAKYGMSMVTLGLAEELKEHGIAVNSLWPATTIDTAAVRNVLGGEQLAAASRSPQIVADAAHVLLTQADASVTGRFLIDDHILLAAGAEDLSEYGAGTLVKDFFLA